MPATICVNNRTVVHAQSQGILTAPGDVCLTPSGSAMVPVPYVNLSQSTTLALGSLTVTGDSLPLAVQGSKFATSTGDEAGTGGGVISKIIKGPSQFVTFALDVMIEGKPVARQSDNMVANVGVAPNTPAAPEMQPPLPSGLGGELGSDEDQDFSLARLSMEEPPDLENG